MFSVTKLTRGVARYYAHIRPTQGNHILLTHVHRSTNSAYTRFTVSAWSWCRDKLSIPSTPSRRCDALRRILPTQQDHITVDNMLYYQLVAMGVLFTEYIHCQGSEDKEAANQLFNSARGKTIKIHSKDLWKSKSTRAALMPGGGVVTCEICGVCQHNSAYKIQVLPVLSNDAGKRRKKVKLPVDIVKKLLWKSRYTNVGRKSVPGQMLQLLLNCPTKATKSFKWAHRNRHGLRFAVLGNIHHHLVGLYRI